MGHDYRANCSVTNELLLQQAQLFLTNACLNLIKVAAQLLNNSYNSRVGNTLGSLR